MLIINLPDLRVESEDGVHYYKNKNGETLLKIRAHGEPTKLGSAQSRPIIIELASWQPLEMYINGHYETLRSEEVTR